MNDLRTAAQHALEALEFLSLEFFMLDPISPGRESTIKAITALRAALAEPVEEPVAWHYTNNGGGNVMHWGPSARLDADIQAAKDYPRVHKVTPLYLAPPQRKPLTDEEIQELSQQHKFYSRMEKFVRIIERAHGIGGNDD
jgi:hypothetical protein